MTVNAIANRPAEIPVAIRRGRVLMLALVAVLAAARADALTQTQSVASTCVDATGTGTITWGTPGSAVSSYAGWPSRRASI